MKIIKTLIPRDNPYEDYYEVLTIGHVKPNTYTVSEFESSLEDVSVEEMNERYEVTFYDTIGNVYDVTFEE